MHWRGTDEFSVQAWAVAVASILSSLVGLGEIGFGCWLVVLSRTLGPILGGAMVDAYYGYIAVGAFAALTGLLGSIASLMRRLCLLTVYAIFLVMSLLFLIAICGFIYAEQNKVSAELVMRIAENPEYSEQIDFHFNCRLNETLQEDFDLSNELEVCSEFVMRQLWYLVWVKLGVCGAHVCLQFVLFVMAVMLSQLVKRHGRSVQPAHPARLRVRERDSLDEDTTSSIAPFFSTPPITPITRAPASHGRAPPPRPLHIININSRKPGHPSPLYFSNGNVESPLSPGLGLPSNKSSTTRL